MRHTLKAVFDNRSDAQHVLEELIASGYTHAEHIEADDNDNDKHDEGLGASVRHAFGRLFGAADKPAPDRHIVMFTTESDPEAEGAAGIIGRFHPADLEERHEEAGSVFSATGLSATCPPGTEPGALQRGSISEGRYFGTQNAASPPMGNTFQQSMGAGTSWERAGQETAYRYGKDMGVSEAYRDHTWDEAEPSLKIGWERKHARDALPAWHRIRDAVRRGWDRVKARRAR